MALGLVLFLAVLQGASELFPVSSLGHAVLVPALFHLGFNQSRPDFVPLLALLHLGTATALLVIYQRDWRDIIAGFFRAALRGSIEGDAERMSMLLLVGTVPTGIIGFFGEAPLKSLFTSPRVASTFLICNGAVLAGAELLRRRDERRRGAVGARETADATPATAEERAYHGAERLSFRAAVLVGLCQSAALIPGMSRSGVTIAGGLTAGLTHEQAVRFAFLLATPIILAAGLLEVPQLSGYGASVPAYIAGAVVAGVVAYGSARFLIHYFRSGRLDPFAAYCAGLGIIGLLFVH